MTGQAPETAVATQPGALAVTGMEPVPGPRPIDLIRPRRRR